MRNLTDLNQYRDTSKAVIEHFGSVGDETCGCFWISSPIDSARMRVVASNGEGWDHISISRKNRCPNWLEMEHAKRLFFQDDETAMQLHVPAVDHRSYHDFCLHIWRPHDAEIPRPPAIMVAPVQAA